MPTPQEILAAAAALARDWWPLATIWHVYAAVLAVALAAVRPLSNQFFATLLIIPLVSVTALAWFSGNPFTTIVLGIACLAAGAIAAFLPRDALTLAARPQSVAGAALALFGFVYPHFLEPSSPLVYLYAAPLGIVPCPTLSLVIGFSLIVNAFESRGWAALLGVTGTFYGVYGAARLGVALDWVLVAGSLMLMAVALLPARRSNEKPVAA